jgi:hypothetical protein
MIADVNKRFKQIAIHPTDRRPIGLIAGLEN